MHYTLFKLFLPLYTIASNTIYYFNYLRCLSPVLQGLCTSFLAEAAPRQETIILIEIVLHHLPQPTSPAQWMGLLPPPRAGQHMWPWCIEANHRTWRSKQSLWVVVTKKISFEMGQSARRTWVLLLSWSQSLQTPSKFDLKNSRKFTIFLP